MLPAWSRYQRWAWSEALTATALWVVTIARGQQADQRPDREPLAAGQPQSKLARQGLLFQRLIEVFQCGAGIVAEHFLQIEFAKLPTDPALQPLIGKQPVKRGAVDQPQIAVIALIPAQPDYADLAPQGRGQKVYLVIRVYDLPVNLKLGRASDLKAVNRLGRWWNVVIAVRRHRGRHGIFAVPRPRQSEFSLLRDVRG